MRYCINYYPGKKFDYLDEIEEVNILFDEKHIAEIVDFMQKHPDFHYNIEHPSSELSKTTINLFNELPIQITFTFVLYDINQELIQKLEELNFPIAFKDLVTSWEVLDSLKQFHPVFMNIYGPLCFELPRVAEILHQEGIKVRTQANMAQTLSLTPDIKSFFIRPEDVELFEDYIDCLEFCSHSSQDQENILYKVYVKDKKWFGKLNEIICDLNSEIDNRFILPGFAETRINCGKRCLKGRTCQVCPMTERLSEQMKSSGLIFKTK